MKNKIADLNNHLFEQLERLNADDLKGEKLQTEISRAHAMAGIANNIVGAHKVIIDAYKLVGKGGIRKEDLPAAFTDQKQISV